ncbi:AMP-dependent synthetase and ligase [Spirochaeta thermophila DSM 6578]|uniref:AMP-dependent synthetase and ligase n=1 Tax=Winmispira thermophila (strain ATCC 700085 / DSM 6578 / Z-1203) TaxID=869211 RepID=G0GDE5_WINT7|nr:AMP-binding protein [Spirochaeta thermophila]AEJ60571.1 AMP-dependent synthetase and ligase [Spirochaeta thermophila DSM 6578]
MVHIERKTLSDLVLAAAKEYAERPAFDLFWNGRLEEPVTYAQLGARSTGVASLLRALGVGPGDRVMILAENRPGWPVAYFGISLAGAISVPVLLDFSTDQVREVASHAGVRVVCATERSLEKLREAGLLEGDLPVLLIDSMDDAGLEVLEGGERRRREYAPDFTPVFPDPDETASLIYTSGTTGHSKGVMLSHASLVFEVEASRSIFKAYPRDRFFSVLPLAHTYECTIGMLIATASGARTTYLGRPPTASVLLPALHEVRPTVMLTVPLIIEKIYRTKVKPSLESHPLYRFPLTRPLATKIAGRKLLASLGGAIRFFGIGGAALAPDVEAFLKASGFPYAIGYGLTETAPLVAGSSVGKTVLRSTGPALKGVEVRIVDQEGRVVGGVGAPRDARPGAEGEIQVRGPNVMKGYYRDPERTREAFTEDGWFRTGDLGAMDRKGRLFIKGRLKSVIVGPSGENIYPEEIESLLNLSDYVEESLVYEGEKGELVALIVLSERAKTLYAALEDGIKEAGRAAQEGVHEVTREVGEFVQQVTSAAKEGTEQVRRGVEDVVKELVAMVNRRLPGFSRIRKVEIREEPLEKTATHKIRRFLYTTQRDGNDRQTS